MRLIASLLISAALFSSAAWAENARLQAAIRLYQRAELDAATAELKAAEEQSKDENDLVQILIYRGLVYAETGQPQQMQESFKRALAMRPWAEVPQDTSPRLAKLFSDARREVWGSPGIKPWPKKAGAAAPGEAAPTGAAA
jgi:tetratricopeptide (TPR) repeat protein